MSQKLTPQTFEQGLALFCEQGIEEIGIGYVTGAMIALSAQYLAASDDNKFISDAQKALSRLIAEARKADREEAAGE